MEYFETRRGRPVYNLQSFLRGLSKSDERIYPVVPDGIFGDDTKRSVESFQIAYNLPVTGEADSETWAAIIREYDKYEAFLAPVNGLKIIRNDEIILKGDKHDALYIIQSMIVSLSGKFTNIRAVAINGIYDDETGAEVENLKIIFGIDESDITKRFINSLVDLYEHSIVFKNDYYDSGAEEENQMREPMPMAENVNNNTENNNNNRNEETVVPSERRNDVIVWKFF